MRHLISATALVLTLTACSNPSDEGAAPSPETVTVTTTAAPEKVDDLTEVCAALSDLGAASASANAADSLAEALTKIELTPESRLFFVIAGLSYAEAGDLGADSTLAAREMRTQAFATVDDLGLCP